MELTVAAALGGDRGVVVEALLADGAVSEPDVASRFAERLLSVPAEQLPQFA